MFVEAVLNDHSLDTAGFTYFVPDFLVGKFWKGSVVEVPFGESLELAVVTAMGVPPPDRAEAKAVAAVAVAESVLSSYQIDTARDMAVRYFVRFDQTLAYFLPRPVLRRFAKLWADTLHSIPSQRPEAAGTTLFYDREGAGAAKLFGTAIPAVPGTALVLPSEAAVEKFLRDTPIPKESFLVHGERFAEAADFRFRVSAMRGERPFLVWTRKLCSYNLAVTNRIVYFEDQLFPEARHRFFHSYSNLFLLERFAANGGPAFDVSSYLPRSSTMAKALTGEYRLSNV